MRYAVILAAVTLAGCGTTRAIPPIKPDPCPPSAAAAVEPNTARIALTEDQQLALDMAGLGVLGDLYSAYVLGEAQHDARAARLEDRVEQTREWCSARG